MKKRTIVERPGWSSISAVRNDHVYEIKSTYILQPGPAALTDGVERLHDCIARAARESDPGSRTTDPVTRSEPEASSR
jgi:iron complex transport system substrate-binding protein